MNEKRITRPTKAEETGQRKPRRKSASLTQIAEMALRLFVEDPSPFWSSMPELANAIELHLQASSTGRKRAPVFDGYLTERDRETRLSSLADKVERYESLGTLEREEARKALELAAMLQGHAAPYKEALLQIVERVLGMPMDSQRLRKLSLLKGKAEHHTFELVRGLTLSLTWDGQLIRLELDPKEYQYRRRAMAMVGIGRSGQTDIAVNHDRYLWDERNG